jgi:hypothetical protein
MASGPSSYGQLADSAMPRLRASHIFAKEPHGHYVEPAWCSRRLFEVERFGPGGSTIVDPCCGWGRIPKSAHDAGYRAIGCDIVDRGAAVRVPGIEFHLADFLADPTPFKIEHPTSLVFNPSFDRVQEFAERALTVATHKVAMIFLWRRLPAAHWLRATPLYRIYMLTPRPSMPPGSYIEAGEKVGGGTHDFCWLVWLQGYDGAPQIDWLHRDAVGGSSPCS